MTSAFRTKSVGNQKSSIKITFKSINMGPLHSGYPSFKIKLVIPVTGLTINKC